MAVMGYDENGNCSICKAKPENRGKGRCKHVAGHIDLDLNQAAQDGIREALSEYSNKNNSSEESGSMSKKSKKEYIKDNVNNEVKNTGDGAEIYADIALMTGQAEFDDSMPYRSEDIDCVLMKGVVGSYSDRRNWEMRIYPDGHVYKKEFHVNRDGSESIISEENYDVDMEELAALNSDMKWCLEGKRDAVRAKNRKNRSLKTETSSGMRKQVDKKAAAIHEEEESRQLSRYEQMSDVSHDISKLLGVPGNKTLKSNGDKADVKLMLKTGETIDNISTKSWVASSNPSVLSGSGASRVNLIGRIPDSLMKSNGQPKQEFLDFVNDMGAVQNKKNLVAFLSRNRKFLSEHNLDAGSYIGKDNKINIENTKSRFLSDLGVEFSPDNAIVMNGNLAESMDRMTEEARSRGLDVDVKRAVMHTAFERAINGVTSMGDIRDKSVRDGFAQYCTVLGTANYNPSEGLYDPDEKKISTFAEVYSNDKDNLITRLVHRDMDQERAFLMENGTIQSTNYRSISSNRKTEVAKDEHVLSRIKVKGNAVMFPVHLSLQLKPVNRKVSNGNGKKTADQRLIESMTVAKNEFVCSACFLAKNYSQFAYDGPDGPVCNECA